LDGERVVLFNLAAVTREHLFAAARSLLDEGHAGPAVVVAQAAVEVGVETAVSFALRASEVPDALQTWIEDETVTSWSPVNRRVQKLWTALTRDTLTGADGWETYSAGVNLRHGFVHRAQEVPNDGAEQFIEAAQKVVAHVAHVMANLTLSEIAKRSS
jgi:hypothetical protein